MLYLDIQQYEVAEWLLIAHIAVLGYWLGSELVINSVYRYVSYSDDMPFAERTRLMDHVMHVDQHVRYALVLQTTLGTMLASLYGYIPGGEPVALAAAGVGLCWLGYIEVIHRMRNHEIGHTLARIDRASRYVLITGLVLIALGLVGGEWPIPLWLRWKLAAFACVMACGIGIRFVLITLFQTWTIMAEQGVLPEYNVLIRQTYMRATSLLVLLWAFIAIILFLSIAKPM